ncbi:uncharacterized protein [Henckelia pumila]|uniref:uncharacterized protein n=1 Tax=Henckelia pumila TaxID=405737 RepID=UPI003C6DF058
MGKWNRRYLPRKRCRYHQYEEPPPSSSNSVGIEDNRVPSWEVDYCNSLKIPWYKISASKKYIYGYPTILNWDDSAGKEAFHNAKQRYWAMINGLPCDKPLPDRDMFIDEIDWNPYLDPELMTDIETLYFNPDKSHKIDELETINEEVEHAEGPNDTNQRTNNPWERDHSPSFRDTLMGWRQYHDSWEQSQDKIADSIKDNGWRSGKQSSGWGPWPDNSKPFSRGVAGQQEEGWGRSENNSWTRCHGNSKDQEFRNWGNCGYSQSNDWSTGFRERGWRDNGNGPWVSRDEPNCWDHGGFGRGDTSLSFRGGGRKRESSFQSTPKYKSTRYRRL